MTMLRMLSFAPQADSKVLKREKEGDESDPAELSTSSAENLKPDDFLSNNDSKSEVANKGMLSDSSESYLPEETVTTQVVEGVNWAAKIDALDLGGISRMIAENAIVTRWELPIVELKLDQNHDTLLSPQLEREISEAISKLEAVEVSLSFEVGLVAVETVAKLNQRLEKERQERAEAAINSDPKISGILDEFEGEIKEIKPIG